MTDEKHPFDVAAEQLEAMADQPVAGQDASPDYWEIHFAADASVGDFPQAVFPESAHALVSRELGTDGFPVAPIPEQTLQERAKWTDVLSSNLWSDGYLVNQKALAAFKQCELGDFREFPASVRDPSGQPHALVYLYVRNIVSPEQIDFRRSEFYISDMLGIPQDSIEVDSFADWEEKVRLARAGELDGCEKFSLITYKTLYFRADCGPPAELFRIARLGTTVYVSSKLRDVVVGSAVTGVEFKANRRLYVET